MEIFVTIITFTILLLIIASPIIILYFLSKLNRKNSFILYFLSGIIVTFLLFIILGWWSSFSNDLLLSHYGYDFEAMNDFERFKNVAHENLEKVKTVQISMLGIGWPLKVIMTYVFYFPILIIIYLLVYFFKRKKFNLK